MTRNKRWTAQEDTIVVSAVKDSPTNLKTAFKAASKKTGRSEGACSNRWYTVLSKDKANACFVTISGKHQALNRKNGKGVKSSTSIFTRVLKILGIVK